MRYIKLPRPVHICNCGDHAWVALTRGYITLVSPEDADLLRDRAWCAKVSRKTVYARSGPSGRKSYLHREIMRVPDDVQIDHENGVGLDNRRKNLRQATNQQNCQNGSSHRDSTSRFKGVSWYRNYQKWRAAIYVDGKQKCIGYFDTEIEAAKMYDLAAITHFGPYARLNF